jgi:hypothetical protein
MHSGPGVSWTTVALPRRLLYQRQRFGTPISTGTATADLEGPAACHRGITAGFSWMCKQGPVYAAMQIRVEAVIEIALSLEHGKGVSTESFE